MSVPLNPDRNCVLHAEKLQIMTEELKSIKHTVFGNGKVGLDEEVRLLQRDVNTLRSWIKGVVVLLPVAPYLGEKILGKLFTVLGLGI